MTLKSSRIFISIVIGIGLSPLKDSQFVKLPLSITGR